MTLVLAVLILVVAVNCLYMFYFINDLTSPSARDKGETGNSFWIGLISFFQFLLSTFGISDFAIGSAVYSKLKWVSTKKLPGTLNSAAVIPVAFMALIYITSIEVDLATLVVPIVAQAAGAYFSPRFVVKMPTRPLRVFLSLGMFVTVLRMVGEEIGFFPAGGTATALSVGGLALLGGLCLLYGALNNLGLGSYAPTMATVHALGLNPIAAFPIMMGAAAFSVPVGSIQFIRHDSYSRKVTIISAIFGTLGVLIAAFLIKDMSISAVRWLIAGFLFYSACTMLYSAFHATSDSVTVPKPEKTENKLSAAGRLTSFCVVLVLLCAVSLIVIFIKNFQKISYNYTETSISAHNAHLTDNVEAYLSERESLLLSAKVGVTYFMNQASVDLEQLRLYLEKTSLTLDDVSTLYCTTNEVWNKPGGYAVFSQPWDVPQDWDNTERLWFLAAKNARGDIAYSKPYVDALTGDTIIDMSCNIYDEKGNDIGVISMSTTIDAINNMLLVSGEFTVGGHIYIIDSDGVFVVHSDREMVAEKDFFNTVGLDSYREDVLLSDNFYVENNGVMISSSSISNAGWFLVSITPVKEILTPINNSIISMFMTPLLIIIFMLLIVLISLGVVVRGESKAKLTAERITMEKDYFIARVSHEIRTPMNAVIGMSELARRDYGTQEGLEYILGIKNAGASLLTIINDILDFSKMEAGHLELKASSYETVSMLNDVFTIIRVRMSEKKLDFLIDVDPNIPKLMIGDAVRVKQILTNLLSNAVKYTNKGFIHFTATGARVKENEVRLTFVVKDSGIGIKPEDMHVLFGVFARIDEKRNSNVEGTGLGLSIARNLCRAMAGDITAESKYGEGSTFTATLIQTVTDWKPTGDVSALSAARTGIQHVTFTAPSAKVLVVDDVPTNLLVARGLLSPYEMVVDTCESGKEAIELIKSNKYDMVLMDHMMPDMDGIEATSLIREMKEGREVPIIALTANAVAGMQETFLQSGMKDFLSKPIDVSKLDEMLSKWIPKEKKHTAARSVTAPFDGMTDPMFLKLFCRDAEKAIKVLRETAASGDHKLFATTAHAIKPVLANIGETDASALAEALEKAGKSGDTVFIAENTESFIKMLEALIQAYMPDENENGDAGEDEDEDTACLTEQLQAVMAACEDYDDAAAYAALDKLKEKRWKNETAAELEEIRDMLFLHSDFETAALRAEAVLLQKK